MSAYQPCRYCGETELLSFHPEFDQRLCGDEPELAYIERGEEVPFEYVAFVACDMCLATAPVDIWNGTKTYTAEERATYVAYCEAMDAKRAAKLKKARDAVIEQVAVTIREAYADEGAPHAVDVADTLWASGLLAEHPPTRQPAGDEPAAKLEAARPSEPTPDPRSTGDGCPPAPQGAGSDGSALQDHHPAFEPPVGVSFEDAQAEALRHARAI